MTSYQLWNVRFAISMFITETSSTLQHVGEPAHINDLHLLLQFLHVVIFLSRKYTQINFSSFENFPPTDIFLVELKFLINFRFLSSDVNVSIGLFVFASHSSIKQILDEFLMAFTANSFCLFFCLLNG